MKPPMERIKRRGEKSPGLTSGICQYLEAGEEREYFLTCYDILITLKSKSDKAIIRKKNYILMSLINTGAKIIKKIAN